MVIALSISNLYFMLKLVITQNQDTDYQKLGLTIKDYEIEYCIVCQQHFLGEYKIYKLKNWYHDSMDDFKKQLANSKLWSRNKFYEYVMLRFEESTPDGMEKLDRENLYFYDYNGIYAIFDLKNAKLYYYRNDLLDGPPNHTSLLGVRVDNCEEMEVYDVRGGLQYDGTDYCVYRFSDEDGKIISNMLKKNNQWKQIKSDKEIPDCFKYNEEANSIKNGYYYYELICRTSDMYKKYHFTEEEATGFEAAIYDVDKHILYYNWTSI